MRSCKATPWHTVAEFCSRRQGTINIFTVGHGHGVACGAFLAWHRIPTAMHFCLRSHDGRLARSTQKAGPWRDCARLCHGVACGALCDRLRWHGSDLRSFCQSHALQCATGFCYCMPLPAATEMHCSVLQDSELRRSLPCHRQQLPWRCFRWPAQRGGRDGDRHTIAHSVTSKSMHTVLKSS